MQGKTWAGGMRGRMEARGPQPGFPLQTRGQGKERDPGSHSGAPSLRHQHPARPGPAAGPQPPSTGQAT